MSRSARRGHGERRGGEESNYLVSLGDLMSGLVFIFLIIVMYFVSSLRKEEALQRKVRTALTVAENRLEKDKKKVEQLQRTTIKLGEQREDALKALKAVTTRRELQVKALDGIDQARANLLRMLKELLVSKGVKVEVDPEHGLLRLPAAVLFQSGADTFVDGGGACVEALAGALAKVLPSYLGSHDAGEPETKGQPKAVLDAVVIEGHTDNRPVGGGGEFKSNWELSTARAIRTYHELKQGFPALATLRNERKEAIFAVAGYADSRPVAKNDTDESRARNRRIDIRFLLGPSRLLMESIATDRPASRASDISPSAEE
jgi:chemotaxis protein MotB